MTYLDGAIELLRQMVRTPSPTFEEGKVTGLISSTLDSWGVSHDVLNGNIIALCEGFDDGKPTLALDAHIDTVPPCGGYSFDPFDPGEDPAVVRGLGSNDDGGSVVSMAAAFRELRTRELPFNLALCLSREEERAGSNGAAWIYGPEGPFAGKDLRWVIIGEPTGMRAATSERGLLVLDGEAAGVSGHAARDEGVNALYIALEDIAALRQHRFGRVSPTMGEVRLNVTQIEAGSAHNVIPDRCRFVVDIRPTDVYSNEEILAELQAVCKSSLKARNLLNRASATYPASLLMKTADTLGIETFSSPTTSNWIRTGRDSIKMGPGDSARSHHADEYLLTSEIAGAIEGYKAFIAKLAELV
ncbi:MAG: M20/M25/M40 family metallo-hydrolase [Bacteroidales bacterium]|nr:M20/M25/M40 family metallo-hydrolase [Bacteroidales bacterium]